MADAVAESVVAHAPPAEPGPLGWGAALASAAMFATSGAFAKPLLLAGWSPAAVVVVRLGLAALVLAVPAGLALRGRWGAVLRRWRPIVLYGLFGGALVQVAYFNAIRYVDVSLALLLEYLGVVLVVGWVWVRTRRRPARLTLIGSALALGGLAVVLAPAGVGEVDPRGVAWALLAALGMAVYFVTSAETDGVPPPVFVAGGLAVGSITLLLAGLAGIVPLWASTDDVVVGGWPVAWWVPLVELVLVAAAAAYLLGFVGARRLGSTRAGFVGLTEVLFAVGWAWLLLGEVPGVWQAVGGAVLVAGVALVQRGTASG